MRNVEDGDLLIKQCGYNAGKVYIVIASNENLFVIAEMFFSIEDNCYMTDINKLSAHCNRLEVSDLKELGFSKTYPRQY